MNLIRSLALITAALAAGDAHTPERKLDPPPISGVVQRPPGLVVGYYAHDERTGLQSVVGVTYSKLCQGDFTEVTFADLQAVFSGAKGEKEIINVVGSARTDEVPYEVIATPEPVPNPCEKIALGDIEVVASGVSTFTANDNDLSGAGGRERRIGFRAQGTLYNEEGQAFRSNTAVTAKEFGDIIQSTVNIKPIKNSAVAPQMALESEAAPLKEPESSATTIKHMSVWALAAALASWVQ